MEQSFRVAIPTPLRSYTEGAAQVTITTAADPARLADVFTALDLSYPGIRFRMMDEAGRLRPHVQVFVDGKIERNPTALLSERAEIFIIGALSGG